VNVTKGDVLLGRVDLSEVDEPYARIWLHGRWLPISFDPGAVFLVLTCTSWDDECGEVSLDLLSLISGDRLEIVTTSNDVATKMRVVRGDVVGTCDTMNV